MSEKIHVIAAGDRFVAQHHFILQSDINISVQTKVCDEAINLTEKFNPHVVILDSGSREAQSLETAYQILKTSPQTNIIIIAADNSCTNTEEAIEVGASSYLPKRVNSNELLDAVRTVANDQLLFYF